MSNYLTVLPYVYIYPAGLLHSINLFHVSALCLFILHCCIHFLYYIFVVVLCVYLFNTSAVCLLIPRCCTMSFYSKLLCYFYLFHTAALYPISAYSTLAHYVYLFCADALCLYIVYLDPGMNHNANIPYVKCLGMISHVACESLVVMAQ